MLYTTLGALCLATATYALPELSIAKVRHDEFVFRAVRRNLQDRATVNTTLFDIQDWGTGDTYYLNLTVGTPPQNQIVILDTGSSDFYLIASSAANCQKGSQEPCLGGSFDRNASTTYTPLIPGNAINLNYQDGSYARGPFGTDWIGVGDVRVSNVPFGVAVEESNTAGPPIGILGLGFAQNQTPNNLAPKYATLPQILHTSNITETNLYSIALTGPDDDLTGSIVLGGIDTSRYVGNMVVVNMLSDSSDSTVLDLTTNITAITVNTGSNNATILSSNQNATGLGQQPLRTLLDTGTSAFTLPRALATSLLSSAFPYIDTSRVTPCSHQNDSTTVTVEFAKSLNITIPMNKWLTPIYDDKMRPVSGNRGTGPLCTLNLNVGSDELAIAGDAVMRNMYTVFDLTNAQLGLAKVADSKSPSDPKNIVTAKSGPSAIANALQGHSFTVMGSQAPTNIPSTVVPTATFVASTVPSASVIGTATGSAAVPVAARPSQAAAAGNSQNLPEITFTFAFLASIAGIMYL